MAIKTQEQLERMYFDLLLRQYPENEERWNDLIDTLLNSNVDVPGPYANDAAAAAAGVAVNRPYALAEVNDYDIPSPGGRTVVKRLA